MFDGLGAQHEHAARGHGVHGVEDQIFDGAMQQGGVSLNDRKIFLEMQFGSDRRTADGAELSFKKFYDVARDVVEIHGREFGLRHFREITEAADDGFQIVDFAEHDAGGFPENFVELRGILFAGALQIFDRSLQREQRILEFMREAAGEFAPGGDAFDLHELFALLDELAGHLIKGFGELGDFVAAMNIDAGAPIAVGNFARGGDEFLHRAGDARGAPPAE